MKKIICALLLILCLTGCFETYNGWKEIEIAELGSIKIPQNWTCHINGKKIYFTDEGVEELTEDSVHLAGYIYDENTENGLGPAHQMFDKNAIYEELLKREVFSNSTFRGIIRYEMHGVQCEKSFLELEVLEQDKEIYMIVWDDAVSYEDIKKMAKSFIENIGEE